MHKWDEYISIKRIHRIQFRNNLRPYFPISKEILIFCCLHLSAAFLQFRWRERMEWNAAEAVAAASNVFVFHSSTDKSFFGILDSPSFPPIQHTLPLTHSLAHPNSLCRKFIQKQTNKNSASFTQKFIQQIPLVWATTSSRGRSIQNCWSEVD